MREFLLGSSNIQRIDERTKTYEELVKDGMLLYRHSARCPQAMQMFLNCNRSFWSFVPMKNDDAQKDNASFELSSSIPVDPTSPSTSHCDRRSDHDTGICMIDLPPMPNRNYTFSSRQCAEQFQLFRNKHNRFHVNMNLDLYNASIVAVLPESCSGPLQRIVEALFITHAQTRLNTIGHLDRTMNNVDSMRRVMNEQTIIADRGDWCANLDRCFSK